MPLDDYYLWCDHRAKNEAAEITELAHREKLPADRLVRRRLLGRMGLGQAAPLAAAQSRTSATSSSPPSSIATWWRRRSAASPTRRQVKRSICAAGHKWLWHAGFRRAAAGGFPGQGRPAAQGRARQARRRIRHLRRDRGASDAGMGGEARPQGRHSDSGRRLRRPLGRDRRRASRKATWSTSSARRPASSPMPARPKLVPGVCGVVKGSVHPQFTGIEAGLSAVGDVFSAIATRAGTTVAELSKGLEQLSRRTDRPPALPLGQRRPHGAGQRQRRRHHHRLEPAAHGAGRAVRGDRGHRLPHARHPRPHERVRRADRRG